MAKQRAALVTGGSRGIGLATGRLLRRHADNVINLDMTAPQDDTYRKSYEVDFRDLTATQAALAEVADTYDILHLVNNVGYAHRNPLEETSVEELVKCFEINLRSALLCTQAVIPAMKAASYGRIVNISSRAALGKELRTAYAAMKGGIISMTRVWALELAPHGITVNAIGPGPIATDIFRAVNPAGHPATKALLDAIPVKRAGNPEDVAHAVDFFLGEQSGYVTGQILYVCGGLSIGAAPI